MNWLVYCFRNSGWHGKLGVVLIVLEAAAGAALPYAFGLCVSAAGGHDRGSLVIPLAMTVGLILYSGLSGVISDWCIARGSSVLLIELNERLVHAELDSVKSLSGPGPDERFSHLTSQLSSWEVVEGFEHELTVLYLRLVAFFSWILVCMWNPFIACVVFGLQLAASVLTMRWIRNLQAVPSQAEQMANYYRELLVERSGRHELRVFGTAPLFLKRFEESWKHFSLEFRGRAAQGTRPVLAVGAVILVANIYAFMTLGADALAGDVGVGDVVTVITAVINIAGVGMLGSSALVAGLCSQVVRELDMIESESGHVKKSSLESCGADDKYEADSSALREMVDNDVILNHVSFAYPTGSKVLLEDLSLTLKAGSTTALVGVNGSGKSTIVKLICGLLEPIKGSVYVKGEVTDRERYTSAIFQENAKFPLTVEQTISLDETSGESSDVFSGDDLKTISDRMLEMDVSQDARTLSGGQWQRVMLARAMYFAQARDGILVLDEPSAALDPVAERSLFSDVQQMAGERTLLLVTHHLATVKDVDRIVVVEGGRIVEDGNHEELMSLRGAYWSMFETQKAEILGLERVSNVGEALGDTHE